MFRATLPLIVGSALLLSCDGTSPGSPAAPAGPAAPPVTHQPLPVQDAHTLSSALDWAYKINHEADLDRDGKAESIILTAQVEVHNDGTPLWEHGHRWAAYISAEGVEPTLIYDAFVPNGHVELSLDSSPANSKPVISIAETSRFRDRSFVIAYDGPASARVLSASETLK